MIIRVGLSGLLALSLLLSQNLVLAAVSGLSITDRQLISKQRVSRTAIDYTYTLTAHNTGAPLSGVVATVSSLSGDTVIQQAEVVFGALDSGSTQSTETFVLRQDRRVAFDPADLVYTFTADVPAAAAMPALSFKPVKIFRFSWTDVDTATHYKLLENPDGKSGFTQVGEDIPQDTESIDHVVPLYARINGQYVLQSCNAAGCRDSAAVAVSGKLVDSIGHFKGSNIGGSDEFSADQFGYAVSLSADGNTLAVGARHESSSATGINGDQGDNSMLGAGAVYVFTRSGGTWSQQAYVKASNTDGPFAYCYSRYYYYYKKIYCDRISAARFGTSVSLSADGNTLAVGAVGERSSATGINGDQGDSSALFAGAVYVFTRSKDMWSQQAYVKASNTGMGKYNSYFMDGCGDSFGASVSLSANGDTLAVGAFGEESNATGINGDQGGNRCSSRESELGGPGAVYVFTRSEGTWFQQAYIKASNTGWSDKFGSSVSLSGDGDTLAVGALGEDSNATGVNGDQSSDMGWRSGAVYVFTRSEGTWFQQAYIKASNTGVHDYFGASVSLSADGDTLAVGAFGERSNATGINGDQSDNSVYSAGAVYVFTRSEGTWFQQAYIKASSTEFHDHFGSSVSLSGDGDILAVNGFYVFTRSGGGTWFQQASFRVRGYNAFVSLSEDGDTLAGGQPDGMSFSGAVYLY